MPSVGRRGRAGVLLLVGGLVGCGGAEETAVAQAVQCRVAQRLVSLPTIVPESSGAAMSRRNPDVVWTHNDSGGDPMLFAVDLLGRPLGSVRVTGAENVDWEDLAAAPCGSGSCLYISDTGDNEADRDDAVVYRIEEPTGYSGAVSGLEVYPIRFPDGPHDVEALFVLPPEQMYFVTKGADGPIALYRYPGPPQPDRPVELEHVRALSEGNVPLEDRVTGADASPDGRRVALRTRTRLIIYQTEDLLSGSATAPVTADLRSLGESQGEGLAFAPNGVIVLTSEAVAEGFSGTLGVVWCPESAADGSPFADSPPV